jgi:hypothetical protein
MLADLYGVSRGIISKHIEAFADQTGEKIGNFWTVSQVIKIIECLGPPPQYEVIYPNGKK